MEKLVAAFAAMSSTNRNNNNNNNLAASPPATPPVQMEELVATLPVQMEELVATFAASVTLSGNENLAATPPAAVPSMACDCQEMTSTAGAGVKDGEPAKGEEACVVRVRFPDGRVLCRSFGAGLPTAALFRYCRSVLLAADASARGQAFRLVKLAGGASDEVRASSSSTFRDLGLHRCTVHVVPA